MASPLILLGPGIAIGFLPMVGSVAVKPQIVPEVILPPLLFGAVIHVMVPEASPAWAIALGAVLGHRRGLMTDSHALEPSSLAQDCDVAPFEERLRHACDVDEEALAARSADRGRLV